MKHFKNKKILVTGGAGFIGSHLTKKLVGANAKVSVVVKYNSIIEPIRSRCLCIRIPADNKLRLNKINSNNIYHIQIYNEYNTYFQKYKDPSQILCEELFIIYHKDLKEFNFKDIQKIRNISYQLLKSNIPIIDFYYQLFNFCMQKTQWTFNIKLKCIQSINDSEYLYHKSYKSIIHIESLLIQIYYLTAAYYEINSQDEE